MCWCAPVTLLTSLHSRSWTKHLEEVGQQKSAEVNYLQRCGLALEFDWKQHSPCLVNLTADLSLSGTLLFLLPAGVVRIGLLGETTEDQQPDIALSGPLVNSHHWYDCWTESSLIYCESNRYQYRQPVPIIAKFRYHKYWMWSLISCMCVFMVTLSWLIIDSLVCECCVCSMKVGW